MADMDAESYAQLKKLMSSTGDPTKMPSRRELLELLDASELADDVKENLRKVLVSDIPQVFGSIGSGGFLAILFVLALFAVILFFGYKLFKSIKEKEKKREEKKKAKQMKKKK